ncbi:MAG: pyridoxamine 5'-phosphate oxidase family protein [Candidatus Methanomethylophilaceae archaeon]|nr:pyridoxamine 5'-phosphate oxidase family protein [Thermoplasmata archaeon]MBQ3685565.1 pyridoxamine 5'-phosphate oxidase family protein [Candidatus Methanomethylophilaceae archaeon]
MQPLMEKNHMSREEAEALLARNGEGVLSTNGGDGYPYGTPVNYILMDGAVYFHGRPAGEKVDNMARDPKVCLTVTESGGFEITGDKACNATTVYESVIVRGRAAPIESDEEKARVLRALAERLVPEKRGAEMPMASVMRTAVYRIDIDSITGKYRRPMAGHRVVRIGWIRGGPSGPSRWP